MGDSSSPNPRIFSVRIVSLDYYMAPPIPGLDISYSSFQGGKVNEVPVIRIYGSTPAGQKTCLHIHGALPYLYVPCSDLSLQLDQEGNAFTNDVSLAIEKALKLKGNAGSKRQHVHGCSLVRAKKFYGYYSSEDLFLKICLYYPQDVSRISSLLLAGAILDKTLQPHESHIPFLLQFLMDYNLYGMGHLHISKLKFRHPVPNVYHSRKDKDTISQVVLTDHANSLNTCTQADSGGDSCLSSPIWTSSAIPDGWTWPSLSQSDSIVDRNLQLVKRQSTSELEGDALVEDILNQLFTSFTSLSQTHSELKMVQSLVPIWEELERSGMQGLAFPPDPGKPLPHDVLKTLTHWLEMEKFLSRVGDIEGNPSFSQQSNRSLTDEGNAMVCGDSVDKNVLISLEGMNAPGSWLSGNPLNSQNECQERTSKEPNECIKQLPLDQFRKSSSVGLEKMKAPDLDALGLLKWLASSQAAEELNSDDELAHQTILSPFSTIDAILEKANAGIENQSQQECQDILDSIADLVVPEESSGKNSSEECNSSHTSVSSSVQAGCLDNFNAGFGKSPYEVKYESKSSMSTVNSCGVKRKKPEWGCLPVSSNQGVIRSSVPDTVDTICTSNGVQFCEGSTNERNEEDKSLHLLKDGSQLVGCSVRDLMRKKRFYRIGDSDSKAPQVRDGLSKEGGKYETCSSLSQASIIDKLEEYGKSTPHKQSAKDFDKQSECSLPGKKLLFSSGEYRKDCLEIDAADLIPESHALPGTESFEEKASVLKSSYEKGTSSRVPQMHSQNQMDVGISVAVACTQRVIQLDINQKEVSCLPEIGCLTTSATCQQQAEPRNLIGLTLPQKPPDVQAESEENSFHGGVLDDILPFFPKENLEEMQLQNDGRVIEQSSHSESVIGVPVHYQNDGSYLYMLTPVRSPPSEEHVNRWLSVMGRNSLSDSTAKATALNTSSELLGDVMESQDLLYPVSDLHLLDSSSILKNKENCDKEESHNGEVRTIQKDDSKTSEFQSTNISPEISQLSGPDVKSKLTPLSQMGFRDPASVSGGQQLTIMSIEIHAGCRGDLRPDPRFDAIDFITLVVQEDDDTTVDAFILMLSKGDVNGKNVDGLSNCKVLVFQEEKQMFGHFVNMISAFDPDILMGWDIQSGSLGFLAERAAYLDIGLLNDISRTPSSKSERPVRDDTLVKANTSDSVNLEDAVIEDEWGRTHASGVHVSGRIVLNIWRLMRGEVKLNMYTLEAVAEAVLRKKVPFIPHTVLAKWFSSGPGRARYRCLEYLLERAKLNLHIMNQHDMINRTSELARVFGIDFFSVLSRGSQYRVESMLLRLAHTQNYVAISPGNLQVAHQPAMECLPLVMEPESGFYADPVVVLDFQSLYPSMIIAYNLCFCTCLGKITPPMENILGVSNYSPDMKVMQSLKHDLLLSPNGVMYVPSKVRRGVIPRLLEEILSTRIMVKQAMKKLAPSEKVLRRIYDARQLALKLIANVTYGYTAAGFSGRMPCAELADSIVQCGRRTLENAISFVNNHDKWKARVIYGDTDSLFVLLKGCSTKEAFRIGDEIASAISALNPHPVVLKMEKVYHPCFLLTKKRYVGYSYENPDQINPKFDAKGIETVRRDSCAAVSKTMERSLRLFFEQQDINKVKAYLLRQWTRIISGRVSVEDFVFAKEVRLGTYSARTSSLPPAAIVATKAMRVDPRAEPRYGERVPYVVVHGEPGSRLADMVVDPMELLAIDSPYRLNEVYYIKKQIIPVLQRVFGLVGADLNQWFSDMPRPEREAAGKRHMFSSSHSRTRIDAYYLSKHCVLCGALVQGNTYICLECSRNEAVVAISLTGRTAKLEKDIQHLVSICRHCGGGDWLVENGVKCTSLACSVFYERRKTQKELKSLSAIATESGFYPKCAVEWF